MGPVEWFFVGILFIAGAWLSVQTIREDLKRARALAEERKRPLAEVVRIHEDIWDGFPDYRGPVLVTEDDLSDHYWSVTADDPSIEFDQTQFTVPVPVRRVNADAGGLLVVPPLEYDEHAFIKADDPGPREAA